MTTHCHVVNDRPRAHARLYAIVKCRALPDLGRVSPHTKGSPRRYQSSTPRRCHVRQHMPDGQQSGSVASRPNLTLTSEKMLGARSRKSL